MDADDQDIEAQAAADDDDDDSEAGDGEVAVLDEYEITEADRDRDWGLAIQVVAGFFAGLLAGYGVAPGVIGAMFQPVVAQVLDALRSISRRRIKHSAETLLDAADAAGLPLPEFVSRATATDERHELTARVLLAAQDTARRDKRRALGRALAAGVMDDARIDEELMFVRAMDDIDAWHIELLDHMASNAVPQPAPGWSARTAVEAVPIIADVVNAVLGALELHGLIAPTLPPISRGPKRRTDVLQLRQKVPRPPTRGSGLSSSFGLSGTAAGHVRPSAGCRPGTRPRVRGSGSA